ncbi:unnamed protein product [Polarella glacialis]|uniref:Uncharacterized protein n=1 Tax=Polarella glacialis TaxID=89957 RepID=A0A813HTM6_POLGL|nr:unnamed protein product [Polarella glacialis]
MAPETLLRTKGYLRDDNGKPVLVKIEVIEPSSGRRLAFSPEDGSVKWGLAKAALFSIAFYTIECFHTGTYRYSASVIMAVLKSVPVLSQLGSTMAPQSIQVIFAMFEMAAELHSNHGSVWSCSIWDANITGIWSNCVDIQQFLLNATPTEILGMGGNSSALPAWWVGKAHAFIAPIEAFATSMSAAVVSDSAESLEVLPTYIYTMSLVPAESTFNVTTASGLAKFYTNMLFVQGICHTSNVC